MSIEKDRRENRPTPERPARFGRTVAIEWIQPREPEGGWIDLAGFEPEPVQTCLSVGRLIRDDDRVKVLAGSAMLIGDDERLMLSGVIEIPARCVVRIVRLKEVLAVRQLKKLGQLKVGNTARSDRKSAYSCEGVPLTICARIFPVGTSLPSITSYPARASPRTGRAHRR